MPVCLCIFHSCFPAQKSIYNRDHMVCKAGKIYCLGFSEKICQPSLLKKIILFQEQTLRGWSFFCLPVLLFFSSFSSLSSLSFVLPFRFLSSCCRRDMACCYSALNTSPNPWAAAASHLPSPSCPQWGLRQPPESGPTGEEGFRVLPAAQASHFTLSLF